MMGNDPSSGTSDEFSTCVARINTTDSRIAVAEQALSEHRF